MFVVARSLLCLAEVKVTAPNIPSEAYRTVVLLDCEDDLEISANLAKTVTENCALCVSHTLSHEATSARRVCCLLWTQAQPGSPVGPGGVDGPVSFEKEPFLLECLKSCVGGCSAAWLCVILCAIWTLHTCY